ncbi:GnsA/GnsB family addiction module toxin [Hafnia paralvei]|uniref:GnsA/GnsB family addiction module toxin n=1 Tax=Hafnia paralvei TaxID=546367 RepID=UPI002672CD13|nr:addiction module toxin, GnsA/GnsB family [Hafnia paralvei]
MATAAEIKSRIEGEISELIGKKIIELKEKTGLSVVEVEIHQVQALGGQIEPVVRMTLI